MPAGHRPAPPPGTAKVVFAGTVQGHQWRSVMWLSLAGSGITSTDLNTLATSIATAWGTRFTPSMTNVTSLTSVTITFIPSAGVETVGAWGGTQTGASGSAPVNDAGASAVISWKTSLYYRGGHPRTYMPGLQNVDVTNGALISGARTAQIASAAASFRGDVNGLSTANISSVTLGTVSFQRDGAWRVPPAFIPFGATAVRQLMGSQRRRLLN